MADLKIGLAFSGGGFRAAAFSLGVLTYLDKIKINDKSLLQCVTVLSTVSGGTITGARYAIGIKQGEDLLKVYESLYLFMRDTKLIDLSLDRLVSQSGWQKGRVRSIINAFADVYDSNLFNGQKFGTLLQNGTSIHLKDISFNATEFANGMQFRFQMSQKINNPQTGTPDKGLIGNYYYRISDSVASQIRMGDILAASSCFPGGFEPINFPNDFVLTETEEIKALKELEGYPVGLMDGGIVDNQGIEPLLLANDRMKLSNGENKEAPNPLDLIIVSDVASPYMEEYKASRQKATTWFSRRTPKFIFASNTLLILSLSVLLYFSIKNNWLVSSLIATSLLTICVIVFILAGIVKGLPAKVQVPKEFLKPIGKFLKLKLFVYENIIMNRVNSVLKMSNDVFLKHVRRLNYNRIYEDKSWHNRRIMNAIYELRKGERKLDEKIKGNKISKELIPSDKIQQVAATAADMGTTLWFTEEELKEKKMLHTLIACGQFNICWNMLEYIEKIEKNKDNTNSNHLELIKCKEQMMKDWAEFNKDPFWMVNSINNKIN